MFRRQSQDRKVNILQRSIDNLIKILQNSNIHELTYILGSKKEIIKRNLLAGISRGIGTRHRVYHNNCSYYIFPTKNSKIKYSSNWKIYK